MLTALQERVARIVTSLPEADGFALAGGAALVVAGVVDRTTRDLDFFGPSAEDVDRLLVATVEALTAAGLSVRRERDSYGFARLTIASGDDSTEVDLAADARIRPAQPGPFGPMLSIEELAADKLLALFGRAQARDFVDVDALIERFGLDQLCQLAHEKDPGFSRAMLGDMLGGIHRFGPQDFELDDNDWRRLQRDVDRWRTELQRPAVEQPGRRPGLEM